MLFCSNLRDIEPLISNEAATESRQEGETNKMSRHVVNATQVLMRNNNILEAGNDVTVAAMNCIYGNTARCGTRYILFFLSSKG